MSLIELVEQNQIKKFQEKIKQDCIEFNKLSVMVLRLKLLINYIQRIENY